jgi:CheY-like chemotaxis protein
MGASTLTIGVEDTGIGIPMEYQERIYDEFFQIAGPARDRSKGLGLGLSIVRRCCDLLGHQLTMRSGPDGSLFQIQVPCSGFAVKSLDSASSSRAVSERLRSAFVLVIDDDAQSRYAAQATYQQWGCNVVASESIDDALEALNEHLRSPDLIVTDFHLGNSWNGIDGVKALRARAELAIPAIVLTGEITALEPFRLDASFLVLQKPAGWERLREASERLLGLGLPENMPAYSET